MSATLEAPAVAVQTTVVVRPSSLGWVAVASTSRGVRQVLIGDDPDSILSKIQARLPNATIADDVPNAVAWAERIVACFESPSEPCDVPLDIQGTPFQRRVWDALRAIPAGETASYSEIARRIGSPAAIRAVGTACGSNPVAPIIPCHRVLRSDGSLGGYGFGLERKKMLLERECNRK